MMKKFDVAILIVFVIAVVILGMLEITQYDILLMIIGLVIAAISGIAIYSQNKKINDLMGM